MGKVRLGLGSWELAGIFGKGGGGDQSSISDDRPARTVRANPIGGDGRRSSSTTADVALISWVLFCFGDYRSQNWLNLKSFPVQLFYLLSFFSLIVDFINGH